MVFDIDAVFGEASEASLEDGKKIYYDSVSVLIRKEPIGDKSRFVFGDGGVWICFDEQGGLYEYSCDCGACDPATGPCQHVVAAALALSENDEIAQKSAGILRKTDPLAEAIVKEFSKRRGARFAVSEEKVELSPCLCIYDDGTISLRLKIGRGRKYSVKNIWDFTFAIMNGSVVRYGAGLRLRHSRENFLDKSWELADFLVKCRKDRQSFGLYKAKDEIGLTYGEIDEFFALFMGESIQLMRGGFLLGTRTIAELDSFRPIIRVGEEREGYSIKSGIDGAFLIEGRRFCYYAASSRIFRCGAQFLGAPAMLINAASKDEGLFVARQDMRAFYNNVLLRAGEDIEIDYCGGDLSHLESPPLVAGLYLSGDGVEVCGELRCSYGDVETDIFDDDNTFCQYRDFETEAKLKGLLARYFRHFPVLKIDNDADIYNLLKEGLEQLYNYCDIFVAQSLSEVRIRKPPRLSAGIRLNAGLLELDFSQAEYSEQQLKEISEAYKNENRFVRLDDGSFIDISDEAVGALSSLLILGERKGKKLSMPAYYAPLVEEKIEEGFLQAGVDRAYEGFISQLKDYKKTQLNFGGLTATLRNYQKDGVKWLKMLKNNSLGGILADDMGLGKTLQMLALISDHAKGTSIVICPTSLIINWAEEAARFTPHLRTLQVLGGGKERAELISHLADYDLVITSYELFKRDEQLYSGFNFEIAVLDEAQYIKNHQTKGARAVKKLLGAHRFALTGTPIENSLAELWSIFDFLMPGYLFGYSRFRTMFETGIIRGDSSTALDLKKAVHPFILRRLKSNVLKELPPKTETEITIPLCDDQQEIYNKHLALIKQSLDSGQASDQITILSMLMRLRQICCDPGLVDSHYQGNSQKLETCLDLLKNAASSGGKVLVFSQFTSMLAIIAQSLTKQKIPFYLLEGSTPKHERSRLVERFNKDDTPVFLISLRAGGTGINLTGADTVIHYDPWWNDAVMNQATDRAYRLGQNKSVQVYKLIIKDSIEEKITALRQKKSALAGIYVDDNTPLSTQELMELIR